MSETFWYVEMQDSEGVWRQVETCSTEARAEHRMRQFKRYNPTVEFRVYEFNQGAMIEKLVAERKDGAK